MKTVNAIKRVLKVEDQNGYQTGGVAKTTGFDGMLGDLNEKIDVAAINKAIQQKHDKDQAKGEDRHAVNLYQAALKSRRGK